MKRSSPRSPRTERLPVGMVGHVHHEVDALERQRGALDARHELRATIAVEHVDLRRARRRADRDLGRLAVAPHPRRRGRLEPEAVERLEEVDLALDLRLRVVRADDHRVVLEERVRPAGRVHQALDLLVGGGDRGDLGERPVAVRVRVVVGQREQQEVEQVVLDQVRADAARVLVAHPRHPELRAAAGLARGEQVGVEELARAVDGVAEDGRGEARQRGLARHLVAVAAAVHQVGRPGGADVGVVERLEHRLDVRREVLEVHVVDRVGERALEAERLRRLEARAVLDVAPLAAVVPVHRRDLVPVGPDAGRDARRAHRRHGRERGDAVVDERAALDQQLQRRRAARRHRPLEHRGLHGVDDREDELLRLRPARAHRRMRRPAYFSPSRRRPPSSSEASAATTSTASGGNSTESPAADERGPSA